MLQTRLNIWIDESVRPWFAGRIIPVTEDILMEWRRILGQSGAAGVALSQPDLLLVATARVHHLTICTRDHLVYLDMDAPVFNPWHG